MSDDIAARHLETSRIKAIALAQARRELRRSGSAPITSAYRPAAVGYNRVQSFAGFKVDEVTGVLNRLKRGDSEKWSDLLCYGMLEDPDVAGPLETRVSNVSPKKLIIESGKEGDAVSDMAAEALRESLEDVAELREAIEHLAYGRAHGWGVCELVWEMRHGFYVPVPYTVPFRDTDYDDHWQLRIRTFDENQTGRWIYVDDDRDRWLVNQNRKAGKIPTMTGDMIACVWPWIMKKWCTVFMMGGLEQQGNGMIYAIGSENALDDAREELRRGLEQFAHDHAGVFDPGTTVGILQSQLDSGSYELVFRILKSGIGKAILGSTLNIEISQAGGNRAAAESQADQTMLPRFEADATAIANSIKRDIAEPFVRYNAHRFAGARTPKIDFQLVQEEAKPATVGLVTLAVQAKAVTKDKLLRAAGLDPIGSENGGDDIADIGSFGGAGLESSGFSQAQEVASPRPLAQAPEGAKTSASSRARKILQMYSDSAMKTGRER